MLPHTALVGPQLMDARKPRRYLARSAGAGSHLVMERRKAMGGRSTGPPSITFVLGFPTIVCDGSAGRKPGLKPESVRYRVVTGDTGAVSVGKSKGFEGVSSHTTMRIPVSAFEIIE